MSYIKDGVHRTEDNILIEALYLLAKDIQSDDGIANECVREAALRLSELVEEVNIYKASQNSRLLDIINLPTHSFFKKFSRKKCLTNLLLDRGINFINQLCSHTRQELLNIPGMGINGVNFIEQALGEYNIKLKSNLDNQTK